MLRFTVVLAAVGSLAQAVQLPALLNETGSLNGAREFAKPVKAGSPLGSGGLDPAFAETLPSFPHLGCSGMERSGMERFTLAAADASLSKSKQVMLNRA